jgi:spore maturation protein CgeB
LRFVIFTQSLVSDWNHGNAHFLRGVATELMELGHELRIFEPNDGWSLTNLLVDQGAAAVGEFRRRYPELRSTFYEPKALDTERALAGADVVIVHEWNAPSVVRQIGEHRARHAGYRLFFHDTHHRSATDPESMAAYDLRHYDGVLAYGSVIADIYRERGWAKRAWTWHEAADTRVFHPIEDAPQVADLVWIGNWGDGERTEELREFLIHPVRALGLTANVYGVRYPDSALAELEKAGIRYRGWVPNARVPEVFAQHRVTVHVPRRPYSRALPGIPTIRPFEALACGIPLVSAPWDDSEEIFRGGRDFLFARTGDEMAVHLKNLLASPETARAMAASGLDTILSRHTCAHRAAELVNIVEQAGSVANSEGAH